MNKKFLLISYVRDDLRTIGTCYIFSYLKSKGIDVSVLYINCNIPVDRALLKNYLNENKFDVIGISITTKEYFYTVELIDVLRDITPHSLIFMGGVHPTSLPEECLQHVNLICIGEGEKVCEEIILNSDNPEKLRKLAGVGFKDEDGNITLNTPSYIKNIDAIPFPRYEFGGAYSILDKKGLRKLSLDDYKFYSRHGGDGYTLITSRSCPNNCSYCINSFYNKLYKGQGRERFFRRRSVKSTIEEIKYVLEQIPTVRFINFMDDHFLVGDEWIDEFIKSYGEEINLPFIIRATPESITEEKIKRLKEIGLETLQMGIQSGSEKTHREIFHRRFVREEIIGAANILHKFGVKGMYDFIIGNEFESFEEKRKTIELMLDLPKPYLSDIFYIIPFPKTDIVKWYEKNGIKPKLDPYRENYINFDDDFFCMLANIVPLVEKDWIIRILADAEDEQKFERAKERVREKYYEFGGIDKIKGVTRQEE